MQFCKRKKILNKKVRVQHSSTKLLYGLKQSIDFEIAIHSIFHNPHIL